MLRWIWGLLFGRKLEDALGETKLIRVHGVYFRIRKINPLDYLSGAKAVKQVFDTKQVATSSAHVEIDGRAGSTAKQVADHYSDVFLASVVSPKLKKSESDPGDGIPVSNLLTDWDLANHLYLRIHEHTYGKKNFRSLISRQTAASKSTP